jgi:ribosomal protein S18 acetylase RimI-like enzyme
MTDEEFTPWREHSLHAYAAERAAAHGRSYEDVLPEAKRQIETILPEGRTTKGHHFLRVLEDGRPVGWLWIGPHPDKQGAAWINDIEIDEEVRGRGIGRRAMLAAEKLMAAEGATELGLNVFGPNLHAIALYQSLGYATVAMQMNKRLATD